MFPQKLRKKESKSSGGCFLVGWWDAFQKLTLHWSLWERATKIVDTHELILTFFCFDVFCFFPEKKQQQLDHITKTWRSSKIRSTKTKRETPLFQKKTAVVLAVQLQLFIDLWCRTRWELSRHQIPQRCPPQIQRSRESWERREGSIPRITWNVVFLCFKPAPVCSWFDIPHICTLRKGSWISACSQRNIWRVSLHLTNLFYLTQEKEKNNPCEIQHLCVNLTLQDKKIKMDNLPETNHSSKQRLSLVVMLLSLDWLIWLSYNENTNVSTFLILVCTEGMGVSTDKKPRHGKTTCFPATVQGPPSGRTLVTHAVDQILRSLALVLMGGGWCCLLLSFHSW